MIYLKLLRIEVKQFFRSQNVGENIVMTVLQISGIVCMAGLLIFSMLFETYMQTKETGTDIVRIFSRYFIFWWALDLAVRFMCQQLPVNNIKPLLPLNISKKTILRYTMLKTKFSFFNVIYLLFLIPLSLILIKSGYGTAHVFLWFLCVMNIVMINNSINILLNKNKAVFYVIFSLAAAFGAFEYWGVFKVLEVSERLFYPLYSFNGAVVILALLLAVISYFARKLIFRSFYLDDGLSRKITERYTANIQFLNRFGIAGTFLNNDLRMIKRNKAVKRVVYAGVFLLFYGLLARQTFNGLILGIFVTGGFLITFGQRIPAWDSSCYPLMMTLNVPYRKYLEAKWWLMVIATFFSMIIGTLYILINKDIFWGVIAGGSYNIGVNSLLFMITGVFNKTPIDLNGKTKMFGEKNSFNMKICLMLIPQFVIPLSIYYTVRLWLGVYPAVAVIALIGVAGFAFRDRAFDFIAKLYKKEKYKTINAYRNIE